MGIRKPDMSSRMVDLGPVFEWSSLANFIYIFFLLSWIQMILVIKPQLHFLNVFYIFFNSKLLKFENVKIRL